VLYIVVNSEDMHGLEACESRPRLFPLKGF